MAWTFTGKLKEPVIDYETGRLTVSFEFTEDFREAYEELKGKLLSIEIKVFRKHRSLDSNRYYWELVGMLAEARGWSNPETHNILLARYGQPMIFDGKMVYIPIPDTEDATQQVRDSEEYHLAPTSQVREGNDGIMYRDYKLLRGSRTYDTKEMGRLIDGALELCRDSGMSDNELATPNEKRILKERYGISFD